MDDGHNKEIMSSMWRQARDDHKVRGPRTGSLGNKIYTLYSMEQHKNNFDHDYFQYLNSNTRRVPSQTRARRPDLLTLFCPTHQELDSLLV
jgi:hypothetical protein